MQWCYNNHHCDTEIITQNLVFSQSRSCRYSRDEASWTSMVYILVRRQHIIKAHTQCKLVNIFHTIFLDSGLLSLQGLAREDLTEKTTSEGDKEHQLPSILRKECQKGL